MDGPSNWLGDQDCSALRASALQARQLRYREAVVQPRSKTRAVVEPSVLILVRRDSRPRNEKGPSDLTGPFNWLGD